MVQEIFNEIANLLGSFLKTAFMWLSVSAAAIFLLFFVFPRLEIHPGFYVIVFFVWMFFGFYQMLMTRMFWPHNIIGWTSVLSLMPMILNWPGSRYFQAAMAGVIFGSSLILLARFRIRSRGVYPKLPPKQDL